MSEFISKIVAALAAIVVVVCVDARAQVVVNFPDSNLELCVRDALGIPTGDILNTDLIGLTSLTCESSGIVSLSGLEAATSLTFLDLNDNQISDISPLSTLTNLTFLDLGERNLDVETAV